MITAEQQAIIDAPEQHIIVLANAGTGKTFTVIQKVKHLIEFLGVAPYRILLTSFSRVAGSELHDKAAKALGEEIANLVAISTIHALCYKIVFENLRYLGMESVEIVDEDYLISVVLSRRGHFFDNKRSIVAEHVEEWMKARSMGQQYTSLTAQQLASLEECHLYMEQHNKLMYDDLLIKSLFLLRNFPDVKKQWSESYDWIITDESQDTSFIQYEIIKELIGHDTRTVVIGDAKQNIYQFRGAHYQYMDDFRKLYKSAVYYLSETFRFNAAFADLSNKVIDELELDDVYKKKTVTRVSHAGEPDCKVMTLEKQLEDIAADIKYRSSLGIPYSDMHILYRFNKESLAVIRDLYVKHGIPCQIRTGDIFERPELSFLITAIQLLRSFDIHDAQALFKVFPNYIGDQTLMWIFEKDSEPKTVFEFIDRGVGVKIAGVGPKKIAGLKMMKARLLKLQTYLDSVGSAKLSIPVLAEVMGIEETKFMLSKESEEGDSLSEERREFLKFFDECYRHSPHVDIVQWRNSVLLENQEITHLHNNQRNAVQLKTMHGSKGQSLPYVYVLLNRMFDPFMTKTPEDISAEMFLLYVGTTRAEKTMTLYHEAPDITKLAFLFSNGMIDPVITLLKNNYRTGKYRYPYMLPETCRMVRKTDKAIQVQYQKELFWLPFNSCAFNGTRFFLNDWIVRERNLYKVTTRLSGGY